MKVNVIVFARVKELVGADRIELTLSDDATVATLKQAMLSRYPDLANVLPHCSVAIDHEYSQDESSLSEGCEVGLIPPVSGG